MPATLDPIIHVSSRLQIMTLLNRIRPGEELSFERVRKALDMTAGNLSVHAGKLEQAGYISIAKSFKGRKPVTYLAMTPEGRVAYATYLSQLKEMLAGAGPLGSDSTRQVAAS